MATQIGVCINRGFKKLSVSGGCLYLGKPALSYGRTLCDKSEKNCT